MESELKANSCNLRKLRESKSWTQEHLADAAGVSLRTVQRIESDGSSSAESRLAIAAALGVPVANIQFAPTAAIGGSHIDLHRIAAGTRWGYAGVALGTAASATGILSGSSSPEDVGIALGLLGAFAGIAIGAIGVLSERARRLAVDVR